MAKPSEPSNVEVGAPLAGVVGGAGATLDVVGRSGSSLFSQTLTDLAMMNFVVNIAQKMGTLNPVPMVSGVTTLNEALGTNAEGHAKPGEFSGAMLDHALKAGIVMTLLSAGNMNSGPAPDVVKQMQAEEEQKKAAIALKDAQAIQAIADEDRKRVASYSTPKM